MSITTTSGLLALAGIGCLGAALTHSILGERHFISQIQEQVTWRGGARSADFMRLVVRLAWHATSIMWAGFGAVFLAPLLGLDQRMALYAVAAASFGLLFIMTGPMTRWRHLGWPVFALITVSLIGAALTTA